MPTSTLDQRVLDRLEDIAQSDYDLDCSNVARVLLRDGWHTVYATTEKDRATLPQTMANVRRKYSALAKDKTDQEVIAQLPQLFSYKERPDLQPKPFRKVTIEGATWAVWNESRDPIPILAELVVPWNQILALDVEKPR